MKSGKLGMLAMAALICAAAGQAMAGPVLWDTGEDGVGGVLADGAAELHYKLYNATTGDALPDPIVTTYNEAWEPAPAGSKWLSLSHPPVTAPYIWYKYVLTFELDALPTEALGGNWMTDDAGTSKIVLNGFDTGVAPANFFSLQSFSITDNFVVGTNTIEFWVGNDVGHAVTGLLVSGLGFPEDYVIPAPAASLLVALGSCAVGFIRQRRWF